MDKIAFPTEFRIFPKFSAASSENTLTRCLWRNPGGSVHTHLTLVRQGLKDIFSFPRIPPLPHKVCAPGSWWWFRVVYVRSLKHLLFSTRWSEEEKCPRTGFNTSSSPASNTADVYKTTRDGTRGIMGYTVKPLACERVLWGRSRKCTTLRFDCCIHASIFHRSTLFWSSSSF